MPIGVHAGRDQRVDRHDPAALADLQDQGVGSHERERPGLGQGAGAELLDVGVELLGHLRDLGLRQAGDAQGLHQLVHPPRRHPQQVAGRHHAGQRPLGTLPTLEEPLGEVGPLPELGHRDVQSAGAGVEVAVPVAVAAVDPLRGAGAVLGAADRVGLSRHQRVDERGEQLAQQIRARLGELFLEQAGRVDTGGDGHRRVLLRVGCRRSLEGSPGGRRCFYSDTLTGSRTPLCWTSLSAAWPIAGDCQVFPRAPSWAKCHRPRRRRTVGLVCLRDGAHLQRALHHDFGVHSCDASAVGRLA